MIFRTIKDGIRDTFVFSGRSERLEHWAFLLFTGISIASLQALGKFGLIMIFPVNWIALIYLIWLAIANTSLMARRMHDHGLSAFWLFLPAIPLILMLIAARALYGSGVYALSIEDANILMNISKGGMVTVIIALGSLFVRPGNKKSNKFGGPII